MSDKTPDIPFPKAGDECPTCKDFWRNQKRKPKKLTKIGTTMKYNMIVPACPYCDGERIIKLSQAKTKKG